MSGIFAAPYARLYDAMYATKDYARECDAIEAAIRRYGDGGAYRAILDLGCGTGNHALPLARRGYEVVGVDISEDMVAIARRKARHEGSAVRFERGDMRTLELGRAFDAALILFAALGYQTADADVAAALANARRHLRPGGLLILDVWNAPTVLAEGIRDRVSVLEGPGRQLIKTSQRTLEPGGVVVRVRVRTWEIVGTVVVAAADETHRMRPFSREELERYLHAGALEAKAFFAFPDLDQPLARGTFDLGCVAIAT